MESLLANHEWDYIEENTSPLSKRISMCYSAYKGKIVRWKRNDDPIHFYVSLPDKIEHMDKGHITFSKHFTWNK